MESSLQRNLHLLPWHEFMRWTMPWGAVFTLFTRARFDLDGAILLSGLYYLGVVVLELPTGLLSDRFGRVITLRFVAIAFIGAYSCWLFGDDRFAVIVIGQVLAAAGFASLSGTDVMFHYDTLEALGLAEEFPVRQARLSALGRIGAAVGALGGGLLGLVDLRVAFAASLLIAICELATTLGFTEPSRSARVQKPHHQLKNCLGYLRDVPLRWIFGYGIALVVLEHVAANLMAPWLTEALGESADKLESTPLAVGIVMASTAAVGAFAARASVPLAERFGVRAALVGVGALSATIVTTMALFQHVVVVALVVMRSVQGAVASVLIPAAIAPAVAQQHRATLLSLDSLGGRLLWGSLLVVLSVGADDDVPRVLARYATSAWILVALTLVTAVAVGRRHGPAPI